MLFFRHMFPAFLFVATTMAQSTVEAMTPVVSLLGMIPECSVSTLTFTEIAKLTRLGILCDG